MVKVFAWIRSTTGGLRPLVWILFNKKIAYVRTNAQTYKDCRRYGETRRPADA